MRKNRYTKWSFIVFLLVLFLFGVEISGASKKIEEALSPSSTEDSAVINTPTLSSKTKKPVQIRAEWSGVVVSVADGDTITVLTEDKKPVRIRLYGVDSPEKGQAFGQRAKQFVSDICYLQKVTVLETETDRYGRTVAVIQLKKEVLLQEEILKNGFAWVYRVYCRPPYLDSFLALEEEARSSKKGLWADKNPIPPWEYRKENNKKKKEEAPGFLKNEPDKTEIK